MRALTRLIHDVRWRESDVGDRRAARGEANLRDANERQASLDYDFNLDIVHHKFSFVLYKSPVAVCVSPCFHRSSHWILAFPELDFSRTILPETQERTSDCSFRSTAYRTSKRWNRERSLWTNRCAWLNLDILPNLIWNLGNTPLVRINSLSDALGVEILGKAEVRMTLYYIIPATEPL